MERQKKSFPAVPAALLSMISVQGGASIAKRLFPSLGAAGTSSLRIAISAVILLFINRPSFRKLTLKQWKYCIAYGLCLTAMNLIFYYSIQRIPLGLGVTVEFIGPLALSLICSRRFSDIIWALLASLGILLIVPWNSNGIDLLGLILALIAGIFWALYIVVGGKISNVMEKRDAVSVGMCCAAVFIIPFGLISGDLMRLNGKLFLMGCGIAIFSSAIPFSLDLIALNKIPAKTFSILMSLQPALGAFSGLIFLGEILTLNQWFSVACVIAASVGAVVTSGRNKQRHEATLEPSTP